ncbi:MULTISPECIES: hypothetical protein [unclassified Streptomyces]|uniref:hypothetical protein n=1 Tax=unclassified Streptomyces TaxID=2593676 RepID=UPI0028851489|nr:hypothetical protein [Streptomyces sp. DSM 41633]
MSAHLALGSLFGSVSLSPGLSAEAETLLARGWITRDADGRLWITGTGDAARADLKTHALAWRARIHEGIEDADHITTLNVLRRMMHNVGGEPA